MKTIAMVLSPGASGDRVIDPRAPTAGYGGGGSRAGFMGLVRAMGRLGTYKVVALSTFRDRRTVVDGVEYVRIDQAGWMDPPDVHFAFYDVTPLIGSAAKLRIGAHHTLVPYHAWGWIDVNTAPCEWAAEFLRRGYRPHGEWRVLHNAVEGLDAVRREPVAGRVVYHTSPDRGLHHLLRMWPEVRRRLPTATLDVVGDPSEVVAWADAEPVARTYEGKRGAMLREGLAAAEKAGGLRMLGKVQRPRLLKSLSEASLFAFPAEVNAPCETWSISVHECLALGVPVLLSPVDALESLWGGAAALAPSPVRDHYGDFVDGMVEILTNPARAEECATAGFERAALYNFDRSARELDAIVEEFFAREERNPGSAPEGAAAE